MKLSVIIIKEYHCYHLHTKFYPIFFSSLLHVYVDFDIVVKLLIRYAASVKYWKRSGSTVGEYIHRLNGDQCNMQNFIYLLTVEMFVAVGQNIGFIIESVAYEGLTH
jgi:hypothetical protein